MEIISELKWLILATLIIGYLIYIRKNKVDELENFKKKNVELEKKYATLQSDYNLLQNSSDSLNKEFHSISEKYKMLERTHKEFEEERNQTNERKRRVETLEQQSLDSKEKIKNLSQELENLKNQYYAVKGQKPIVYSVQVQPYEEVVEEKGIFTTKKVEIGYKYQLFINDIPCFQPHIQPLKTISVKELNEATINLVCEQIKNIVPLHSGIQMVGNLTDFSNRLLTLIPPK